MKIITLVDSSKENSKSKQRKNFWRFRHQSRTNSETKQCLPKLVLHKVRINTCVNSSPRNSNIKIAKETKIKLQYFFNGKEYIELHRASVE